MKALFFGTPDFAVPALEALLSIPKMSVVGVVTQPDRPAGRGGHLHASPVKTVALSKNIPVLQPTSIKKELPDFLEQLAALGPVDIGLVIAFGQILPKAVLEYPRQGCVNVHASLLPRWRGAAPIHRALLAGDTQTGVCLMKMDEGLDTGGVFVQAATEISLEDTGGTLHDRLSLLGASLVAEHLSKIVDSQLITVPQVTDGLTYASKLTAAEAQIDWSRPADEIVRLIRAFNPFPSAYTTLQGKRLKIISALDVHSDSTDTAPAGTVVSALAERLEIATGDGVLRILDLQLEGKKRMSASDFLRGNVALQGSVLGVK
jgi:methionyl-tRNA formyltransferase